MNISLTHELETGVQELVRRGHYGSQSEVVRAGLRLLFQQEQEREARLRALTAEGQVGRGHSTEGVSSDVAHRRVQSPSRRREVSA